MGTLSHEDEDTPHSHSQPHNSTPSPQAHPPHRSPPTGSPYPEPTAKAGERALSVARRLRAAPLTWRQHRRGAPAHRRGCCTDALTRRPSSRECTGKKRKKNARVYPTHKNSRPAQAGEENFWTFFVRFMLFTDGFENTVLKWLRTRT